MKPLIRVLPTKDGGRRVLTEEAKATVAAWLEMMALRLVRQIANKDHIKPGYNAGDMKRERQTIESRIFHLRVLISRVDEAFDADAFDTAFRWVLGVMNGQSDDPAGGSSPGDAVGPSPGET